MKLVEGGVGRAQRYFHSAEKKRREGVDLLVGIHAGTYMKSPAKKKKDRESTESSERGGAFCPRVSPRRKKKKKRKAGRRWDPRFDAFAELDGRREGID